MNDQSTGRSRRWLWIAALCVLVAVHLHLLFSAAERQSVTFDEFAHVPAGATYWTTDSFDIYAHNPPLIKLLTGGIALLADAQVPVPDDRPAEPATFHWRFGEQFMLANWDRYPDLMLLARIPVMALSVAGLLLVATWARRLYGLVGGLLAAVLYAASPTVCAHGSLATVDAGAAVMILAAAYTYWKFLRGRRWSHGLLTGLLTGAALLSKFTALLLLPLFLAAALVEIARRRGRGAVRTLGGWSAVMLTAFVVVNMGYRWRGFGRGLESYEFLSDGCQQWQARLGNLPMPLPSAYIDGFDWQKAPTERPHPTYCAGQLVPSTTWYYYPLALWLKAPLAFLPLVALRLYASWNSRRHFRHWICHDGYLLLMPILFAAGFLLATEVAGARYLLPCLPFVYIWLGGLAARRRPEPPARPAPARWLMPAGLALAAMFVIEGQSVYPRYLCFFNRAVGGPDHGHRWLVDADLDWGQGLIDLREFMRERDISRIQLAYFGMADPGVYGIPYTLLLDRVESEWVAISAYCWAGLDVDLRTPNEGTPILVRGDFYAPFRALTPEALVGHTIFIYRFPPSPRPTEGH